MTHTFIDWNDRNAHGAAEIATQMIAAGMPLADAALEAARSYSAEVPAVKRWIYRLLNRAYVEAGLQCPECSGVRITTRTSKLDSSPEGFTCQECGCQFGARR